MTLDIIDVKKIARLAHLAISEEEAQTLSIDFENILRLVDVMSHSLTDSVLPLLHPADTNQTLAFRPDRVTESDCRDLMQSTAPSVKEGLYIVPQFVENS